MVSPVAKFLIFPFSISASKKSPSLIFIDIFLHSSTGKLMLIEFLKKILAKDSAAALFPQDALIGTFLVLLYN